MYIVVAIIAFGLLIVVHELGHYSAAKLLNVRVNEFAIGMGPKILKKQGKETLYTLRALPFGGFCAMGEDDEFTGDPRSFTAQKRWRRIVILSAGAVANFIMAFIVILVVNAGIQGFIGTTVTDILDGFPNEGENGLMVGDTLVSINGERLYYRADFELFVGLIERRGDKEADLVVRRDGTTIKLDKFPLERRWFSIDGVMYYRYGLSFNMIEATAMQRLRYSLYTAMNYVRLIRVSLAMLFSGAAGVQDLSGPVGIVDAMNSIGQDSPTMSAAVVNISGFMAFIGVNLAVMNMLPIPAMDGGRILFIFITWAIEKVTKRRIDPKYEGYIHTATFILLMGFMAFILVNDVIKIISG